MGKVATAKRKAAAELSATRFQHRRTLAEVREQAAEFAGVMKKGVDPAEAVQDILDEAHGAWQYANEQVLRLPEDEYWVESLGTKVPNPWIREQDRLMHMVLQIASKAASMGLAERMVRLEEIQAEIFSAVVEAALIQYGLNFDQRRSIHESIAQGLDDIEANGAELPILQIGKRSVA